jgi:hypothetical protein
MKTTLCFAGQPRFVKECYPSIKKHIIDPNGITEICAHFWLPPAGLPYKFGAKDTLGGEAIGDFINLYNPKVLKVEQQFPFPIKGWKRKNSDNRDYDASAEFAFKSFCSSCFSVLCQVRNEDNIILIRSDIIPTQDIIAPKGNTTQVFVKRGNKYPIIDWIFTGDIAAVIDIYAYDDLDKRYQEVQDGTQEVMHMKLAEKGGIELIPQDWDMTVCQAYKEYGEDKRAILQ